MMRRRATYVVGCAVVLLSGCIAPALDSGAFEQNAKSALESASSETSTVRLAVDGLLAGKSTGAYADTVVTDSENAMGGVETSFGVVDPPSRRQDQLRDQVLTLLGNADDALAHTRIALRRNDRSGLKAALGELDASTSELARARKALG
ncbi:hypothetical protein [Pedococcus sp. 2YAF34]|uniref:hypothetical protein n=1 Tax=Pedococcus sp. 2YAF34 TaxID=3233032 RepID=UPI003F9DB2BD